MPPDPLCRQKSVLVRYLSVAPSVPWFVDSSREGQLLVYSRYEIDMASSNGWEAGAEGTEGPSGLL